MLPVPPPKKLTGLDPNTITEMFRPEELWARECGAAVRARREELGLSRQGLADLCVVRLPTIYRVEAGGVVPSDRLRVVLAYHLDVAPGDLWRYPSRLELEIVSRRALAAK